MHHSFRSLLLLFILIIAGTSQVSAQWYDPDKVNKQARDIYGLPTIRPWKENTMPRSNYWNPHCWLNHASLKYIYHGQAYSQI
ncbi:MAG: hypothetical protein U0T56_03300 [Ferruginibacter sp.]